MKSIVEEASSVMKAIEKGWVQAGKPQEFSVKVFEIEQKNFIGMTTKSAKIAIFYGDKIIHEKSGHKQHQAEIADKRNQQQAPRKEQPKAPVAQQPRKLAQNPYPQPQKAAAKPEERKEQQPMRETWTPEMTQEAQAWLKETLNLMNIQHKNFTTEIKNYYLKITFDQPLLEDGERERLLFRSFAHLLMQSLRNKFKKGFRGFKIILNSGK